MQSSTEDGFVASATVERSRLRRSAAEVAPTLLGLLVRRRSALGDVIARIVEVEAYDQDDPASHANGGPTARNAAMFADAGRAYVYLSYGIHRCLNVVVDEPGRGAGVLLRAARVEAGHALVRPRRPAARRDADLLRGPGCLGAGLDISLDFAGHDLLGGGPLTLESDGHVVPEAAVRVGTRIGIRKAAERPWRWWITGMPEVSGPRASH
ncbi:MAG: DNA-3-methyladenine glycosylase [Nitriliruptoraceae bacterium]